MLLWFLSGLIQPFIDRLVFFIINPVSDFAFHALKKALRLQLRTQDKEDCG